MKNLATVYTKAKEMILLAEELDPSSRSNVMVIKELRDSNDHLMRLFSSWLGSAPKDEAYILLQIEKARGHVYRAGYDAIDGVILSFKIKIAERLKSISNDAISSVYPDYYDHAAEVDALSTKIVECRTNKDIGDHTLENLEAYAEKAKEIATFGKTALSKIPMMLEWEKKNRRKTFVEKVVLVIFVAIIGGVAMACFNRFVLSPSVPPSSAAPPPAARP